MNRHIATFFVFFLTGLTSIAQTSSRLKDTGIVVLVTDSMTGLPLQKANITLATGQKMTIINAGSTDSTGYFSFKSVPAGYYTVTISFAGYLSKTRHIIITDSLPANQVFIAFTLPPIVKSLENVTITGGLNLIENKADRLVYNVEKDISSQAGVATDVLRKIPQVTVDINGNVELLGNPSVRFLINGKPSTVFGNSISEALQSIPATQIQSIEVMSSPGARYDASGTGGIINIILKKNKVKGFSGIANITAGSRLENVALTINYKKNNVGLAAYFSGSAQLKSLTISSSERTSVDTVSQQQYYLQQAGSSDFDRFGYRSGASLDWDVNTKNNLTFSIAYYNFGNTNAGSVTQHNTQNDKTGLLVFSEDSRRNANTQFNNATFESAIDFRKKFKKEHQELSFSYNYSAGSNNSAYFQSRAYLTTNAVFGGSSSKNPGKDYLSTFSLDFTTPVTNNIQFEIGMKAEIESLISNSSVYTFQPAQNQYHFDSRQSYDSRFRRQVFAAYASSSFSIFKTVNVIAGLRMEHTTNNAVYTRNPGIQIPDYSNLGPSLTLSHTFKNQQSLKLSYAYRLERPDYRDLNPFVNLADPHNIITGNPYIIPEIGKELQMGFNQPLGKENNLNITLLYTYNSPDIKTYTTFYPVFTVGDSIFTDVNVSKRDNIAAEKRWGTNIAASFVFFSKLNVRGNIQLYDRTTKNIYANPSVVNGFEYRGNLNVNYQFAHGLVAEAFGNYSSGLRWQGRRAAFSSYTFAVRKQVLKNKASIGFTAVNAFGKYLRQQSTQIGNSYLGSSLLKIPYRSVGISFLYKFGKLKISKPKEEENYLTKPPVTDN